MPTRKEIGEHYESEYLGLHPTLHLEDSKFKASEIVSILEKTITNEIDSMIFLGCGAGGVATEIQKIMGSPFFVGCDISSPILQIAKSVNKNLLLIKADCEEIPIRNNSIELVLLIDIVEHLKHPWKIIVESKRISQKWVIIRVPTDDCLFHNLKNRKDTWLSEWKMHSGHLWKFNLSFLKKLLEENGLTIIEIHVSKPSFSLIKGKSLIEIGLFILSRLIPSSIYPKLFPTENLILASVVREEKDCTQILNKPINEVETVSKEKKRCRKCGAETTIYANGMCAFCNSLNKD